MDRIDFDQFGHCVVCHKNMVVKKVVSGKVIDFFLPEYSETEYLLNDGSKMRVAICNDCKVNLNPEHNDKVMDCVKKGWQVEVDSFEHWTKEKKQAHMEVYLKKDIVARSEGHKQEYLDRQLEEYKIRKTKEAKRC